ncbi:hypothetical protein CASFOL_006679 [Castilleja foliolosa]|uniref:Uncharacterized protein n=1 Tax=Castilleja foliolosa TaxID=1961234 RepID=A0ABD3EAZ1_9LAMI
MMKIAIIFYFIVVQGILISALAACNNKLVSDWPAKAAPITPPLPGAAALQKIASRRMLPRRPAPKSGHHDYDVPPPPK